MDKLPTSINTVTAFSKIMAVFLFFFFLMGSFLVGMQYQKQKNTMNLGSHTSPSPSLSTQSDSSLSFPSPDGKKKIIIREIEEDPGLHEVLIQENGKEQKLDDVLLIEKVFWSPDSTYIAYSSGTSSAGYDLSIINVQTGKGIVTDEQTRFLRTAPGPGEYDHVFSWVVYWRNDHQLIIGVGGYTQYTRQGLQADQYYLIDLPSGKIVKRLL